MSDHVLRAFAHATESAANAPLLVLVLVALVALVGGIVPGIAVEPVLLAAAAVAPGALLVPLAIVATLGAMIAKTALCIGGLRLADALPAPRRARVDRACAVFASRPRLRNTTLLVSALVGVPPFYVTTLAYGALRLPLATFVVLGTVGRGIRFTVIVLVPQLAAIATALLLLVPPSLASIPMDGAR